MKFKKLYFLVVGILLIILAVILWSYFNRDEEVTKNTHDITPQAEISDEQMRNTIVSLYFINKDNSEIEIESKLIDAKKLMDNPYEELINLWLEGPKNDNLKNNCSKNVKINNVKLENNCVIIDFSNNFIDEYNGTEEEKSKTIYCLVNTLTELTEVDSIKILIDGQENKYLGNLNLSEKYYKLNN